MTVKKIIITPETHWDREWYLPFQEFRAKLVHLLDNLMRYFEEDPDYSNFTLDGQTIPLLDYLEVRPHREDDIKKYVKDGRLSIGPFFVLPDEFLISGESMVRNLLLGHKIARRFGRVMKAGYIPDTFGHIAQLPQILSGFEIPSDFFMRGFGNEYEENNLNMEFIWQAPGNAASVIAIHLILGYMSAASLNTKKNKEGIYEKAMRLINRRVKRLSKEIASDIVLLNNGSDHLYAQPEISEIVKQWNERHNNEPQLIQQDFEYYINEVMKSNPNLKTFQGELRGGRYYHLLRGVFSARMWIKQQNTAIEYMFEKYAEPFSAMAWALDNDGSFEYPKDFLWTGWTWLIKNHPHDSICGCSIDEVHQEMKPRFQWSNQIAYEILKDSFFEVVKQIQLDTEESEGFHFFVLNPLPWDRKEVAHIDLIALTQEKIQHFPNPITIIDDTGKEIPIQNILKDDLPRFTIENTGNYRFSFLADVPALGYRVYYLQKGEEPTIQFDAESSELKDELNSLENEFYKVSISEDGSLVILDKESGKEYNNACVFEDVGDWGDEYDYSWPKEDVDTRILSTELGDWQYDLMSIGPVKATGRIIYNLDLPKSLSEGRSKRSTESINNPLKLFITLYKGVKRIDFRVEYTNNSKDHRLRVLFPTNIKNDNLHADGHFYVVPRSVESPYNEKKGKRVLTTNHQKDFITISNDSTCVSILNKGLPEYEAIKNEDGTITFAITLLRCIEWLSRGDFASRNGNAGPPLNTPDAQCLGDHIFEFSVVIQEGMGDWLKSNIHKYGKEYNCPLISFIPESVNSQYRALDKMLEIEFVTLTLEMPHKKKTLPQKLSFLNIENSSIQLSALKKAEEGDFLVIRLINLSNKPEKTTIKLYNKVKDIEIVNLLEEKPERLIKATASIINPNEIEVSLEPHVLASIKVEIEREF